MTGKGRNWVSAKARTQAARDRINNRVLAEHCHALDAAGETAPSKTDLRVELDAAVADYQGPVRQLRPKRRQRR